MLETVIENRSYNVFRNRKVPRPALTMDQYIKQQVIKKEKKANTVEEKIIKKILEEPEKDGQEKKPLVVYSESLKGYFKELKELQEKSGVKEATAS